MTELNEQDREVFKEAIREASKEWLNDQFAAFGKWTAAGIAAAAFFILFRVAFKLGIVGL